MRGLKRFLVGLTLVPVIAVASLWATSMALEPDPAGQALAPDPKMHPEAVIQVYGADVWGFRGNFAIHTWIAVKGRNEPDYSIYQVIGWRQRRGRPVLSISEGNPARPWFGSPAILLHERRGANTEVLVTRVRDAVAAYPFADKYTMWPGPNSNSFTAWVGLQVPELGLDLPVKAIGQSWMKSEYPTIIGAER
jgi:hypothetical protein